MKKQINRLFICLWGMFIISLTYAEPIVTFTPKTATSFSIFANKAATIKYEITNQSYKQIQDVFLMTSMPGVTQMTTEGDCPNPIVLGGQQSCILNLTINGDLFIGNISGGPVICQHDNHLQCYKPNLNHQLEIIREPTLVYNTGGITTGLTGELTLLNNGTDIITTTTDGRFMFPHIMMSGNTYDVTVGVQPVNQTCTVVNGSGTIGSNDVTNVTVTCSTNTYTVGGSVTGLTGTVTLLNNGTNPTSIGANGSFIFSTPVAQGSTYSVSVDTQPANQTCTISNGFDTMGNANVASVSVTCSTNTYKVGGVVTGLNGTLTLLNNASNATLISANGNFDFSTKVAVGSPFAVTVGMQPTTQTCTITNGSGIMGGANVLNVGINCITNTTTLSVTARTSIPVNGGSGTLTVTNTGSNYIAYNVHAVLPGGWTGVVQNNSACSNIAPLGTCTLQFSSTQPYVAQGNITITGDNISSSTKTALAFTTQGYLIWGVSGTTVQVIDLINLPSSPLKWANTNSLVGVAAQSLTDGASNTSAIVSSLGTGSTYAALACNQSTNGGFAAGTWYLPAICQLGASGQGAGCLSGLPNIETNLYQLGFGGISGLLWSSTEGTLLNAWNESFNSSSLQYNASKTGYQLDVRCVRAITL